MLGSSSDVAQIIAMPTNGWLGLEVGVRVGYAVELGLGLGFYQSIQLIIRVSLYTLPREGKGEGVEGVRGAMG
jgi:hypothetical protein